MSNIEGSSARILALTIMVAAMASAVAEPPIRPSVPAPNAPALKSPSLQESATKRPEQAPEIIVRFKDDAKVKDIVDTFWKSVPAAKAKFEAFKKDRPEMADTALERVTYSGELVLVRLGRDGSPKGLAATRAIAARLAAAPDIAYAEVDATARIGVQ